MHEYRSIDIQYIWDIKKNEFQPKNIMKPSNSVKCKNKAGKNLIIGTNCLEVEAKV